jgi:hypothetical protein
LLSRKKVFLWTERKLDKKNFLFLKKIYYSYLGLNKTSTLGIPSTPEATKIIGIKAPEIIIA